MDMYGYCDWELKKSSGSGFIVFKGWVIGGVREV